MKNQTFFLVGSERSGTTLLRLMLSHHPEIACAPEFEFLVDRMPGQGRWPELGQYYRALALNRVFLPHDLTVDRSLDYPDLARSFVRQFCERTGKPLHGATCHHHFDRLPGIWPEARFVHLLRDGRDVARSCIRMGWAGNVWYGVERWIEALACWGRLQRLVPEERRILVRYEDLILDTEAELGRICGFLGVEFEAAMFEYAETSTYERPDASLVAQWKRKLSAPELALLEARVGPMLREHGYEKSGVEVERPGAWRRLELYLDNRLAGFRFRRDRYGLRNVLASYLARRLGMSGLERRSTLHRNAIDNRYLQ